VEYRRAGGSDSKEIADGNATGVIAVDEDLPRGYKHNDAVQRSEVLCQLFGENRGGSNDREEEGEEK